MDDIYYMEAALKEAKKAYNKGEVPIGAVIEYDKKIIARAYNKRNTMKNPLYHAEMIAISKASKYLEDWRLEACTIYVTVEPCAMCSGAILQSRIKRLVYASSNNKSGSAGSIINILDNKNFNHQVIVEKGILKEESTALIKTFFKELREN